MDQAILLRTGARNIPYADMVPVKGFNSKQLKQVRKLGGFGEHRDVNGRFSHAVTPEFGDGRGNKKVAVWQVKEKKKQRNNFTKEYENWLENIFEYETSGRHPNVKPSEVKQKKRNYKNWVDGDRPIQGVDV
jgi:hypothetical protein